MMSSKASTSVIVGRVLSGLAIAALTLDASMKLIGTKEAIDGTVQLGYAANLLLPLGLIQATCLVLYVIPRTSPIGAVLLTGYFGGAVATHLRLGNPLFTHILSGVWVCVFLWGGLYPRDARVRALVQSEG